MLTPLNLIICQVKNYLSNSSEGRRSRSSSVSPPPSVDHNANKGDFQKPEMRWFGNRSGVEGHLRKREIAVARGETGSVSPR